MTEEILVKLANVNTVEELNAILAENNVALEEGVTPEAFLAELKAESDELNVDDLDNVAGGIIITTAMVLKAAVLGLSIAAFIKRYYRK